MKLTQQDLDAINRIGNVSKHKHARIIAKWLITGWDVEFKNASGTFVSTNHLVWHDKTEYRLVEPKPAYRVYKSGTITNTADRFEDGRYSTNYREDLKWLSDWIEYDPESTQKKWPTPLVERIAAIDIKAAEWIVDHWDELLEDRYTSKGKCSRDSKTLCHMFLWDTSEQGCRYWGGIASKLGES